MYLLQKAKKNKSPGAAKKKKKKKKKKSDKKVVTNDNKYPNGIGKEDAALMENPGFEDTEMTAIKVEVPQWEDEEEVTTSR